jgi:hypothetical protein
LGPESKIPSTNMALILSERRPERLSVRGGESKNLRLFFDEPLTHHPSEPMAEKQIPPGGRWRTRIRNVSDPIV